MRNHLLPTAAAFALCVFALPFAANAQKVINPDQTKNVTPTTAKLPAAATNIQAVTLVKSHIVLKPTTGYIGLGFGLGDKTTFDQYPFDDKSGEGWYKIEVQVANWAPQVFNFCQAGWGTGTCGPHTIDVPESAVEGTFPLKARVAKFGRMLASDWATATLTLVKSPTQLTLKSKNNWLPPALAPVAAIEEEVEVTVYLKTSYDFPGSPDNHPFKLGHPVQNRGVVVNVPGGAVDGQVPPSNNNGEITFRVLHSKLNPSHVQIAFMGDSAYQPSNLLVTVP